MTAHLYFKFEAAIQLYTSAQLGNSLATGGERRRPVTGSSVGGYRTVHRSSFGSLQSSESEYASVNYGRTGTFFPGPRRVARKPFRFPSRPSAGMARIQILAGFTLASSL